MLAFKCVTSSDIYLDSLVLYLMRAILFFLLVSASLSAQRFDDIEITTHKLTDQFHVLFGAGGNIALFSGPEGLVMIDDQFAELSSKIRAAIDDITPAPVKYLINTHWHGDHTGGNENFANLGATIVAHQNVREKLSHDQKRPFGRSVDASPEAAWPKLTFDAEMQIHINGETIQLIHVDKAHTDGDALIYFTENNILHMGDCFFKDRFPFVDVALGGSPDGVMDAVSAALMLCDADTKIIPGHGAITDKGSLKKFQQMLMITRDRVVSAIADGVEIADIDVQAMTKGFDTWGDGFISSEKYVQMLYGYYSE